MSAELINISQINHSLPPANERRDYRYQRANLTWKGRVEETFGKSVLDNLKEIIREGKMLEVGCSVGLTTQELSNIFGDKVKIVGIDIDDIFGEDTVDQKERYEEISSSKIKSYPDIESRPYFIQGDGYFPPFTANSFDAIFMMNNIYQSVEHKLSPDQLKIISNNIKHILKPNGILAISGWNGGLKNPFIIYQLDKYKNVSVIHRTESDKNDNYDNSNHVFGELSIALECD